MKYWWIGEDMVSRYTEHMRGCQSACANKALRLHNKAGERLLRQREIGVISEGMEHGRMTFGASFVGMRQD